MTDVRAYLDFLCAHPEIHETILALGSHYTVDRINDAFVDAKSGNNIKTLLVK
jgi:hypothetical protein